MYKKIEEKFVDIPAIQRPMTELRDFATYNNLVLANSIGNHKPAIQKVDMAHPRWNKSQPDWLHISEETVPFNHLKLPETEHFQVQISRKRTQPRIRFDLEKLNDPTRMSAFQATVGGRFAPLAVLVDEDADLDSMVTHFNKAVIDTAVELLGKQRRKKRTWVTPEILDLCDQRETWWKGEASQKEPKTKEIKRKIRTEMTMAKETWIQDQYQEVEACLRKNDSKKAYQLVKDPTTE